jgi:IcmF-related N-terminal domain
MAAIIEKPLAFIKWLFYLAFPMFDSAGIARSGDPVARWLGRIVLVGAVLAILAAINQWALLGLSNVIRASSPWVARSWLPLLGLCLYAMFWLGWWLYRLLNLEIEPVRSDFPDIDRAWEQAVAALGRADISLIEAPLFLILGWSSSTEDDLYRAAGIKGPVRQVPGGSEAPLHVTANRDGVWLTCPGASLLGQYREEAGAAEVREAPREEVMATMADDSSDAFRTVGAGAGAGTLRIEDFQASFKEARGRAGSGRSRRIANTDMHLARLRHLCRLIARDRKGFCPINGVLLTLPIGVDARPDLGDIADACSKDLTAAFDAIHMRCPVLALIGGLEQVEGFAELVERLPAEQVRKRMGQRFPLVPDLTAGEVPEKVEESVEAVTGGVFPSMVHAMFQVESRGIEDVDEVLHGNIELFRFLRGVVERGERMARLVRDSIPTLRGEPVMFGGCYFAGTGIDAATQQAFASGVLVRMIKEDQDSVTWTAEAMDRDATAARTATRIRLAFIVILVLGVLAAAGLIVRRFAAPAGNPEGAVAWTEG